MTRIVEADIVVVGAGSAGCIVAARVSEDPNLQVVLIESGGEDSHPWFHIPAGYAKIMEAGKHYWNYQTEAEPHLDNRTIAWPRGKVIGGSGSVNGLVYLRGSPFDYDRWEQAGAKGWSWDACVPYFRKVEKWQGDPGATRGQTGKVAITTPKVLSEGAQRFINACNAVGIDNHIDVNDGQLSGVSPVQSNIENGRRASSSRAYLREARKRGNLTVLTRMTAQRVMFDERRATGIIARHDGTNDSVVIRARKEVVLAAGAIGTPQLLMLSGIGDGTALARLGIEVLVNQPEVGRNLQDHLLVRMRFRSREIGTLNEKMRSRLSLAKTVGAYLVKRDGPLAIGPTEAVLFARTNPEVEEANVQIQYINFCTATTPSYRLPHAAGFMLNMSQCRPASKGSLTLRSKDFNEPPVIRAAYLSDPLDVKENIEGVRLALKIAKAHALAEIITENQSGLSEHSSDEEILRYIRQVAGTVYHPCGTCRMGDDEGAVLNSDLTVKGVKSLRVADASAIPAIPSSNIQASVLMIAERASDFIKNSKSNY
ncbi:GMC family oxidoreductase [Bordetella sp. 02P26C-1]|uniref:GMC family oxidoreductase n=1 Tax=Bordetella sp. 02P26C-1 TaxID=2683195 RepID=UPI0013553426|nr:GMC family oxidoreductase N-terminal domain-containing protein [Bordetella sp. 02P26C-1]MVW79625.1 FAD-binding protein [Bordetella sp. 02P26C-1]